MRVFDWAGAGLGEREEAGVQKRKRGLLPVVVGERVALRLALGQGRSLDMQHSIHIDLY